MSTDHAEKILATYTRASVAYAAAIDANYGRGHAASQRLARLSAYAELLGEVAYTHTDSAEAQLLVDHIDQLATKIREIADAHLARS